MKYLLIYVVLVHGGIFGYGGGPVVHVKSEPSYAVCKADLKDLKVDSRDSIKAKTCFKGSNIENLSTPETTKGSK